MRRRHEAVVLALQEQDGTRDRRELESPRRGEGEVVVDPPVDARLERVCVARDEVLGKAPGEHRSILRAEERCHPGDHRVDRRHVRLRVLFDVRSQRLLTLQRLSELDVVVLAHPVEPVELFRAVRRDACEARDGGEALVAERSAREHVRAATRDPPGREPLQPESVGDRGDVGGAIGHDASACARRAAVAGPVVADEPDPLLECQIDVRVVLEARHRRSVVHDDREPRRVARFVHLERAPVRRLDPVGCLHWGRA